MAESFPHATFPFTWESWGFMDAERYSYHDVVFLDDFGPISKGQLFSDINVDYNNGVLSCWQTVPGDGEVLEDDPVYQVAFACVPRGGDHDST